MRGITRSVRYWIYNMEKVYGIMFLTVMAVLAFQYVGGGKEMLLHMVRIYFPMMGGIFLIAILMNGANHFIPQALSYGGTRKEVFAGMQIALHLMICQMAFIVFLYCKGIEPAEYAGGDFFLQGCLSVYLLFSGLGNVLCAGCLKFGTKIAMVLYMILVVVSATLIGVFVTLNEAGSVAFLRLREEYMIYVVVATVAVDLFMMAVCYLAIRKYEVR